MSKQILTYFSRIYNFLYPSEVLVRISNTKKLHASIFSIGLVEI